MIALGRAAKISRRSPAELIGIVDESIAFSFDLEVATVLEEERVHELAAITKLQTEILAAATGISLNQQGFELPGE